MRIVIADTSPLRYLVEIGYIDVLPRLYNTILLSNKLSKVQSRRELCGRW